MPKSILIIEDDVELCTLLSALLKSEGYLVTVRHDGAKGCLMATSGLTFDLIIIDLMLPEMDGFDIIKRLRETHVTPVIMLTASDTKVERVFALEIGADDFISKPFDSSEFLARIRAIFRRVKFGHNTGAHAQLVNGRFRLDATTQCVFYDDVKVTLTGTEFTILQLLFLNAGAAVSKEEISQFVFNKELQAYDRTIDMHISNLRKKFATFCPTSCIQTIRGCGYQMVAL